VETFPILALPAAPRFPCHDYQPGGRALRFQSTIGEEKRENLQLNGTTTREAFVAFRRGRDAGLPMPRLILPSIQVNIRAGLLPEPEANGTSYLKLPLNRFGEAVQRGGDPMPAAPSHQEIPAWTVEQVRGVLQEHDPDAVTLLDVRQPEEFAEGHLPGARLIPVGDLPVRIGEVPRTGRPTIVYCRSGMRAARGTALLLQAGFRDVWNMQGGILAWNGLVAVGAPEAGTGWFQGAHGPADTAALAWILERGAQIFYERMARRFAGTDTGDLVRSLASVEEQHKQGLRTLHEAVTGVPGDPVPEDEVEARDTMEGGTSIRRTLAWAEQRKALDVLEFAVAMEVNAYDRYQQAARSFPDAESREVLVRLAREEKEHLDRLLESFVQLGRAEGFLG